MNEKLEQAWLIQHGVIRSKVEAGEQISDLDIFTLGFDAGYAANGREAEVINAFINFHAADCRLVRDGECEFCDLVYKLRGDAIGGKND